MRTREPGDGPKCWCGAPATFGGSCNEHFNSDTGVHTRPASESVRFVRVTLELPPNARVLHKWLTEKVQPFGKLLNDFFPSAAKELTRYRNESTSNVASTLEIEIPEAEFKAFAERLHAVKVP